MGSIEKNCEVVADIFDRAFGNLPRCNDEFYCRLWDDKRIRFYADELDCEFEPLDELNARLACATVAKRRQLLLVMPDSKISRSCAALATPLLMNSVDSIINKTNPGCVLYFGTSVGVRKQLGYVFVGNECLSSIFGQSHGSGLDSVGSTTTNSLPRVSCIYSPIDCMSIVNQYKPQWIAIDCGTRTSVEWLSILAGHITHRNIPAVAWCSNPLSEMIDELHAFGWLIYRWPYISSSDDVSSSRTDPLLYAATGSSATTQIQPLVIDYTEGETAFFDALKSAFQTLSSFTGKSHGRLERDAVMVGWRLLRSIESMLIPADLYETEATHYWGISPIGQLQSALSRFVQAVESYSKDSGEQLSIISSSLDCAIDYLAKAPPPRWNALLNICINGGGCGGQTLLVFPSHAHQAMFTYAILAHYNITETDLESIDVSLISFKEMEDSLLCDKSAEQIEAAPSRVSADGAKVLLVNSPNRALARRIAPLFRVKEISVLLYDYQIPSLDRLCTNWHDQMGPSYLKNSQTLSALSSAACEVSDRQSKPRVKFGRPVFVSGQRFDAPEKASSDTLFEPQSPEDEVASLFDLSDEAGLQFGDNDGQQGTGAETPTELVVGTAVRVAFEGGWIGLFAPDQRINLVRSNKQGSFVRQQYVRALRPNDTILYIHDNKRQSLLELVIARVHGHPSMQIHISLISQWQIEVRKGFVQWCASGKTLKDLHSALMKSGSQIETALSVCSWVSGATLRPRDVEDLHRLADILGLTFTLRHYRRIHQAGDRIHGIHISLGQRLNRWLEHQSGPNADDMVDEATGLRFSDVRDSLVVLRVTSIADEVGPFMRSSLGRILRSEVI